MKKLLLIFLAFSLMFFFVAIAMAGDDAETVNGWVSDTKCGAKGASAAHESCAKKCASAGEKLAIVTDNDQKVLMVDNPDALKGHEGHHVAITGHVKEGSIHVESAKIL